MTIPTIKDFLTVFLNILVKFEMKISWFKPNNVSYFGHLHKV